MQITPEKIEESIAANEGFWPDDETSNALRDAGCMYTVAAIPKDFHTRLKYFGNMFAQMCCAYKSKDEKLPITLKILANAISYFLNSSSFSDEQYHSYDQAEIGQRMSRLCRCER